MHYCQSELFHSDFLLVRRSSRLFRLGSSSEAPSLELVLAFPAALEADGAALPNNELKSMFESKSIVTEPPPGKGAVCCILRGDCSGDPDALAAVVRGWDRTFL